MIGIKRLSAALILAVALPLPAQTFDYQAFLTLRGMSAGGPQTWLAHGPGRLDASRSNAGFAIAQVGGDWTPSEHFDVHTQLLGRKEPSGYGGSDAGVVEAYADLRAGDWQLRAGQFFLPTSRENNGDLWSSPYALSLSAWNSWIAEEFRPIGVDLQWKRDAWTIGATAFRGNDTSGTLLGWVGWTMGNRLSVYDESLPLPPLPEFPGQQPGTIAFGRDLDGKTGIAGRVRFSVPERGLVQLAHVDNRGDRELHRGQYSWQTRFDVLSAEAGSIDGTKVAAEYAWGKTGMGFAPAAWVQADFYTGYVLLSQKIARSRLTGRFDLFATIDRDHSIGGNTTEHGRAWVFAWLYDVNPYIRAGAEFAQITGHRDAAFDARSVTLEVRLAAK